jgi:glutamine cyclotransferase
MIQVGWRKHFLSFSLNEATRSMDGISPGISCVKSQICLADFLYFRVMRFSVLLLFLSLMFAACGGDTERGESVLPETERIQEPAPITYSVVNAYPHDTAAFTQGLELYDGKLYESTGLVGRSSVRKTDLASGRHDILKTIDEPYFAEGLTIFRDTVYQLTWQNKAVFVYDARTLKPIKTLNWSGEGWGIAHDSTQLYISDGTDKIYVVRPGDLKLLRVISVYDQSGPVNNLNELEFIDGQLYANRWQYDVIVRIDPATGRVSGRMDLSGLLARNSRESLTYLTTPGSSAEQHGAVLNGIAWDAARRRLLVTGKLWPHIFELKIEP